MHSVVMIASSALHQCTVAEGRADAYFELGIQCWDMAAGALIVQEAGGVVLHPDGTYSPTLHNIFISSASLLVSSRFCFILL